MVRIFIPDNSATSGAGLTGLSSASTNLTIAYSRALDSSSTTYTGANIEAQTTVGTFQAPSSSSKIRFKAVDATAFPGLYELQFHDSSTSFGSADASDSITINIYEATTTALHIGPNMALIPLVPWNPQDGVRMGLTGLANAVPGASGGLFIAGTNAATTVTTAFTTTFTGSLTGSVASVTGAVGSVTGGVTVTTNNDKANYTLASSGLNNIVIESGCDARQALCIIAAAVTGASTGVDTGAPVYKGLGVATTRISCTASSGNRSGITLTLP